MIIYLYLKHTQLPDDAIDILKKIKSDNDDAYIKTENRRSFHLLEDIKKSMTPGDILLIEGIAALGLNESDIMAQISWFIKTSNLLVIHSYPSTYQFGISQPSNMAVLSTIVQTLTKSSKNIVELPRNRHANSGRSRISFPDCWDSLYSLWEKKEISSKEFMEKAGLKKATFYNLLTEYKTNLNSVSDFAQKYDIKH